MVYWGGAVLVGLAAVGFAWLCDAAFDLFERLRAHHRGWPLLVTPLTFVALAWVTQGRLAATRGSGIPQVKAALSSTDGAWRAGLLSVRMALAKMG
ncbi:MAG TPA: chloride channel protein, partial [Gammaproteobacteria bacterium]|nr:chloride channel protein [Gammaproteobacteria bacterium]